VPSSVDPSKTPDIYFEELRTGVTLCKAANVLIPGGVTFINENPSQFAALENLNAFITGKIKIMDYKEKNNNIYIPHKMMMT